MWTRDIQSSVSEDDVKALIEFAESQAALRGLGKEAEATILRMGAPDQAADEVLNQEEHGSPLGKNNCNGPTDSVSSRLRVSLTSVAALQKEFKDCMGSLKSMRRLLNDAEKELMNTKTILMPMIETYSIPQTIFETRINEGLIGMDAFSKNDNHPCTTGFSSNADDKETTRNFSFSCVQRSHESNLHEPKCKHQGGFGSCGRSFKSLKQEPMATSVARSSINSWYRMRKKENRESMRCKRLTNAMKNDSRACRSRGSSDAGSDGRKDHGLYMSIQGRRDGGLHEPMYGKPSGFGSCGRSVNSLNQETVAISSKLASNNLRYRTHKRVSMKRTKCKLLPNAAKTRVSLVLSTRFKTAARQL